MYKKSNQIYLQTWHGTPLNKLATNKEIGENGIKKNTMQQK